MRSTINIILPLMLLVSLMANASDTLVNATIPLHGIPAFEIDSQKVDLRTLFEQGEFYRKYQIDASYASPISKKWITMDSITLKAAPQRYSDLFSANTRTVLNALYRINNNLYSGVGLSHNINGLYDSKNRNWLTETDNERLSIKTRFIPIQIAALSLNAGIQSSGNTSLSTNIRDQGAFYEFYGSLFSPFEGLSACSLSVSDSRTFVKNNKHVEGIYRFDGSTPIQGIGTFYLNSELKLLKSSPIFHTPFEDEGRSLMLSLDQRLFDLIGLQDTFFITNNRAGYPDNPINNKSDLTIAGGVSPVINYKKLHFKAEFFRASTNTEYAYNIPSNDHPSESEINAALLKLSNETLIENTLWWKASYYYYHGYYIGFSRYLDLKRYDYGFTFTDIKGNLNNKPDARDLLYDNDTITLQCPSFDTLELKLSRSSHMVDYIDARRSSQNKLGTTYQAELSHAFYGEHSAYCRNSFFISVSQDSTLYPMQGSPQEASDPFYRKRGVYSFTDINAIPLMRDTNDSVVIGILYGAEEEGSLLPGRSFVRKEVYNRNALNIRLYKEFNPVVNVSTGFNWSKTIKYSFDEFMIAPKNIGFAEDIFRSMFSVNNHFLYDYESENREFFIRGGLVRKLSGKTLSFYLEAKEIASYYKKALTKDYFVINTNFGVMF